MKGRLAAWLEHTKHQQGNLNPDEWLFNPHEEPAELLASWLVYRGVPSETYEGLDAKSLAHLTERNMDQRGNRPSFAGFTTFDPTLPSGDFLVAWLSWYGLTSTTPQNRKWWETLVTKTQRLANRQQHIRTPKQLLKAMHSTQRKWRQLAECTERVLDAMQPELFQELLLGEEEEEEPSAQKHPKATKKSSPTFSQNQNKKKLLAYFLQVAMISVPIVYNNKSRLHTLRQNPLGFTANFLKRAGTKMWANADVAGIGLATQLISDKLDDPELKRLSLAVANDLIARNKVPKQSLKAILAGWAGQNIVARTFITWIVHSLIDA